MIRYPNKIFCSNFNSFLLVTLDFGFFVVESKESTRNSNLQGFWVVGYDGSYVEIVIGEYFKCKKRLDNDFLTPQIVSELETCSLFSLLTSIDNDRDKNKNNKNK